MLVIISAILMNSFHSFLAQYSFPYIKKRLKVVQREFYDLSPIEVALDEMRLRVKDIAEAVRTVPTDLKKLQLRLQVCKIMNSIFCFTLY
jgi:hypothetical protein